MTIQENIELKGHSTFKVGGPARYFCEVKSIEDIQHALNFANDNKLEIFVLASGSNLIISDEGFNGLVIKISLKSIDYLSALKVKVGSGIILNDLVQETVQKGLEGLEWAGGLPGTLGGAVRGNAGAF